MANVERAAEFLLSWRSAAATEEWRAAVQACTAAIKGEGPISEAREAFIIAAREGGRLA